MTCEREQIARIQEGLALITREPLTRMTEALSEATEAMLRPLRAASFKMTTAMRARLADSIGPFRGKARAQMAVEPHRNGTDLLALEDQAPADREQDPQVVKVGCDCCPDRPKTLFVIEPGLGIRVRRNKGVGARHEVFVDAIALLQALAESDDPAVIEAWVHRVFAVRGTLLQHVYGWPDLPDDETIGPPTGVFPPGFLERPDALEQLQQIRRQKDHHDTDS